jgi:outer membrane protein
MRRLQKFWGLQSRVLLLGLCSGYWVGAEDLPATFALHRVEEPLSLEAFRQKTAEHLPHYEHVLLAVRVAKEAEKEADALFDPVVSLVKSQQQTEEVSLLGMENSDVEQTALSVTLPLKATGGAVVIKAIDSNAITSTLNGKKADSLVKAITVTQPLMKGLGRDVSWFPERSTRLKKKQSILQRTRYLQGLIKTFELMYWRHWLSFEHWKINLQRYQLAQQQVEDATKLSKSGLIAAIEILRAKSGLSQNVEAVLTAKAALLRSQRSLEKSLGGLTVEGQKLFIPMSQPDDLHDSDIGNIDQLLQNALQNRPDFQQKQLELSLDVLNENYAKNQQLPQVDIRLSYSSERFQVQAMDISRDVLPNRSVSLTLEWPLGGKAATAVLTKARLQSRLNQTELANYKADIVEEVLNSVGALKVTIARIKATKDALVLAEKIYQAEKKQFSRGIITSTEVLVAARDFSGARSRRAKALMDFQRAKVGLRYVVGDLDVGLFLEELPDTVNELSSNR